MMMTTTTTTTITTATTTTITTTIEENEDIEIGQLEFPLTWRSQHLHKHKSEISFPGGAKEHGTDATLIDTALRETEEELGHNPGREELQVLGTLSNVYITISNFNVLPVVALCPRPLIWNPIEQQKSSATEGEVAAVISVSLNDLLNDNLDGHHRFVNCMERPDPSIPLVRYPYYDRIGAPVPVWGATCLMISELVARINRSRRQIAQEIEMRNTT